MKKIILILGFVFAFGLYSEAQKTAPNLGYNETYSWYTGQASDTIGIADSIWYYDVRKKNDSKVLPYVDMLIDSTGGGDTVIIYLQNKLFTDLSFTTVDSFIWNGTNTTALGEVVSFAPTTASTSTIAIAATNRDSLFSTLIMDTTAIFPSTETVINDSATLYTGSLNGSILRSALTATLTETPTGYLRAGEYWRVKVVGSNDEVKAAIRRVNLKFVKP